MSEVWKRVVCNDNYEVSSLGNVRRCNGGKGARIGKQLKCSTKKIGYPATVLTKNGKQTLHYVHRLVAEAFFGPTVGMDVNHKNGVKDDNRVENLEWCTRQQNLQHSMRVLGNGIKIPYDDIPIIREMVTSKAMLGKEVAALYGVTPAAISRIITGKRHA
jgi:hypothetical protein